LYCGVTVTYSSSIVIHIRMLHEFFGTLKIYTDYEIRVKYCYVSGVPWVIIMGSGMDDWIYWHFYYNNN
jgi:hypothetical protein